MSDDKNIKDAIRLIQATSLKLDFIKQISSSANNTTTNEEVFLIQQNLSVAQNDLHRRREIYLWTYLGAGFIQALIVAVFSITFAYMVAQSSRYIHSSMLGTMICNFVFVLCRMYSVIECIL